MISTVNKDESYGLNWQWFVQQIKKNVKNLQEFLLQIKKKSNTLKTTLWENIIGMRQIMYLPGNKLNKLITYRLLSFHLNVQKKFFFTVFAERENL